MSFFDVSNNAMYVKFNLEVESVLDEDVFNELTELELRQSINGIALPLEEQKKIKEDVKNLLDQ